MYEIKELTIVVGYSVESKKAISEKSFDGHINLQEAIQRSADVVDIKEGAYVSVRHVVQVKGLGKWAGFIKGN